MDIIVTNLQQIAVDANFVREVIAQALRLQGYRNPPDVGVALVDDAYIRVLNREYRGSDYATDVLAFPMDAEETRAASDRTAGPPASGRGTLGDIVISVERAREQARQFKHPLRREVALLAIHGLLHLLGYDDDTETAASAMWAKQKELLDGIVDRGPAPGASARPPMPRRAGPARSGRPGPDGR